MGEQSSSASSDATVRSIKDRIASLVNHHFAEGNDVYYLSRLDIDLGSDRELIEALTGQKLAHFIQSEFDFVIDRSGQHNNILHIVRLGDTSAKPPSPKSTPPRYRGRFWAAFATPLRQEDRRFIDIVTLSFSSNESALRNLGRDIREISAEYIAPPDVSLAPLEIAHRIDCWLRDQHLDPLPFLAQPQRSSPDKFPTLLEQLLSALSGEQLKRVSLPLDVIQSLGQRRDR